MYPSKKEGTPMSTKNSSILISGASIAGPTLAYWLKCSGFTPTVIERAPQLRAGGYPVDVRHEAVPIAQRMGIWEQLQHAKTTFGEVAFVNERHERIGSINIQGTKHDLQQAVEKIAWT
jgi:2-polyprenyl-6-methoxyphenol hydroxylase-like FAD-dependent oxidoreductase